MTRIRRSFDLPAILSMRINAAARERRVLLRDHAAAAFAAFSKYLGRSAEPKRPISLAEWAVIGAALLGAFLAGIGTGMGL